MSTSNKADPEWESQKATIESLYVRNNLKLEGPGGLSDTMARSHGFVKSKAQYERYLKTWGMRKYRKKDDWKSIGCKVAERKRAGKDSDVYFNNKVIPKARVQKQIRRHDSSKGIERYVRGPTPQTPDGFEIRTPVAEGRHSAVVPAAKRNIFLATVDGNERLSARPVTKRVTLRATWDEDG